MAELNMLSRITRDVSDGIIVLNPHGEIAFTNPSAEALLEDPDVRVGASYAKALMDTEDDKRNDKMHQFIIDAVFDKENVHQGDVEYYTPAGKKKIFHLSTSFLFSEDRSEKEGVVVQMSDITEVSSLRNKVSDSSKMFIALLGGVCVWVILCTVWELLGRPVSDQIMTKCVEVFGLVMFWYLWKFSSIDFADMGLTIKGKTKGIITDAVATAAALILVVIVKIVLRKMGILSSDAPFIMWDKWNWASWIYPITVVIQEFLTRSVIQEGVSRIIPGRHAVAISIIVSSLFFGAMHLHKGIIFMVGAMLLLGVFGMIYTKQKTIWGLCIPHYVLGLAITLLF